MKLRNMTSIYLTCKNKMLLLYRQGSRVVDNSYIGTAGGHFEQEELNNAKACVLREMKEEIGLTENDVQNLQLRYVTLRLKNQEIRQNYYFFAEVEHILDIASNEGILEWVDYDEIPSLDMPYTAKFVIAHYLQTGRWNHKLYSGIATKDRVEFIELREF